MALSAITNVNIITMNPEREIIENGTVVIEGPVIKALGKANLIKEFGVENVMDGGNGILMPGMINAHTHAAMTPFRSLADDEADRLRRVIFPLEKNLVDRDFVKTGAMHGIAEMLLAGVTTMADMYYFEDAVAEAADVLGIRGVLGETIVDFPSPDSGEEYGGIAYAESFTSKWKGHPRITPALAPHAPYSLDTEMLKLVRRKAEQLDLPILMHVAEMDFETEMYRSRYNMTPVEYLADTGLLCARLCAAHAVNVTENDIRLLAENNSGVSHNPGANAKAAKGIAPVPAMLTAGIRLGLGTDGPMSNNSLDIFSQMNIAGKLHKLNCSDRTVFPARTLVEMATIGGARALHMEDAVGSIEAGKKADLVLLETDSVNMQPVHDYYSVIVYSANPSNVRTVIADGRVLVKDKKLTTGDTGKLKDEMSALCRTIKEKAGL